MEFTGAPRLLIASDLDHTMVEHGDHDNKSLLRFGALWQAHFSHDSLLVYSTGRSPKMFADLRGEVPLLTPAIAVLSCGTEIFYGDSMTEDDAWVDNINKGWSRAAVEEVANEMNLKYQCDSEQRPHKVSFHVRKEEAKYVIPSLREKLLAKGLDIKLIYSGGLDLDVLPRSAGKGQALRYLLNKLKAEGCVPQQTLVCGDSGNDQELFSVDNVFGVIVANAQDELLQWHANQVGDKSHIFVSTEKCAAGIIEAMKHFNLQPNVSPRDCNVPLSVHCRRIPKADPGAVAREVVEYLLLTEQWLRGDIDASEAAFRRLKFSLDKNSNRICARGIIDNPHEEIESLRNQHGSQKGKNFRIWADRVRSIKLSDDSWLVRFDKWERSDCVNLHLVQMLNGRVCSLVLFYKPMKNFRMEFAGN
ncbi:probable sucrose-phosphatase 2 isoform X2 [Physcomitrium patens]|uniref:Sucrose-phosphatase n=1 Tax=Physcomitrium patens TaxID=3218 RepID=A0A7I4AT14_PHYPA|nr:probable sucrose-phosphatase 2 isoform X2 [Physcomitrium patens]|eukprot:XP_024394889.1 probable sucrose-phosphatase 2 isoform X2 [Physcomitrella patens]